ncbi:MAG: lipocalin family protein [Bacteroidetes bacterium]|nr:lipocalin family protein [Bacteroidota bacterium]
MNKRLTLSRCISCVIVAVVLFSAVGCDNETDPVQPVNNTIIGSWDMTVIVMYDTPVGELTIPAAQFLAMGAEGAAKSTLQFRDDNTASVVTTYTDSHQDTISGTWSTNGNSLTVQGAGIDGTVQFTVDATTLVLTRTMPIAFTPGGPTQDIVLDMKYNRIQ